MDPQETIENVELVTTQSTLVPGDRFSVSGEFAFPSYLFSSDFVTSLHLTPARQAKQVFCTFPPPLPPRLWMGARLMHPTSY